jgi:hypothetical protein
MANNKSVGVDDDNLVLSAMYVHIESRNETRAASDALLAFLGVRPLFEPESATGTPT